MEGHVPTPHTVRRCPVCAYKQGLLDGDRRLAICVLLSSRWTHYEDGQEDLIRQADALLSKVDEHLRPK